VISGVGHETAFTIADFVADQRASTPTAAATAAVPDIEAWRTDVADKQHLLGDLVRERLYDLTDQLELAQRDLLRVSPITLINGRRQQLDEATERLQVRMQHSISLRGERLRGMALQLHSLSPLLTIARGYAVVRREADQSIVSSVQQVQGGDQLTIQVPDGRIPVEVR
jgi:exodeoxyribonuclease VII large subunit